MSTPGPVIRHPSQTWDGRPIGWSEPLETERALRLAISRRVNFTAIQDRARKGGRPKAARIAQAQKQSATKRARGR